MSEILEDILILLIGPGDVPLAARVCSVLRVVWLVFCLTAWLSW